MTHTPDPLPASNRAPMGTCTPFFVAALPSAMRIVTVAPTGALASVAFEHIPRLERAGEPIGRVRQLPELGRDGDAFLAEQHGLPRGADDGAERLGQLHHGLPAARPAPRAPRLVPH